MQTNGSKLASLAGLWLLSMDSVFDKTQGVEGMCTISSEPGCCWSLTAAGCHNSTKSKELLYN